MLKKDHMAYYDNGYPRVPLGVFSTGQQVEFDVCDPINIAIQGMTRSGKSSGAYHLVGNMASLDGCVRLWVIDPTEVLGAPLSGHKALAQMCNGTDSPESAVKLVEELLGCLKHRVSKLWERRIDKVNDFSESYPLNVLVIEELPGVVEWLNDDDMAEGRKGRKKLVPRFLKALRQIMGQGLKVGCCVVLLAQRFDASIITGQARSNIGVRICLRVDDSAAVEMLFPSADRGMCDQLATVPRGRGFITTPDVRAKRFRLFHTDYAGYLRLLGV